MNIYIKKEDIADFDCITYKMLDSLFENVDIISLEEILGALEDLYFENEGLLEKIDDLKRAEEDREVFDYSEWKANQE